MNSTQLLSYTIFGYLLASFLYIAIFVFRAKSLELAATSVTIITFIAQTIGIGLRWYESYHLPGYGASAGHAPLSNMYESLVFFSWCIVIFYLWLEFKFKNRLIGAFAIPFAFLGMALTSFKNPDIRPLVPALQSNWLIAHVITCFVGYAAFAVAAGIGIMYLIRARDNINPNGLISTLPEPRVIDDINHKTMVFGFIWLSAGIITGAIWANSAWGTYWSWDPKETWSLITWFVYALALHMRFVKGWGGRRIAWVAIIGFASVIFTYYGVNYLLSGLHSYGG